MLFLQELKKTVFSVAYAVFVIVTILSLYSQGALDFGDSRITMPQPGENYGTTQKEIPEIIMPAALEELWGEFCENNYRTYPIGFIKHVKLSDREQQQVAEILSEITGVSKEEILRMRQDHVAHAGTGNNSGADNDFVIGGDGNIQAGSDGSYVISLPENDTDNAQVPKDVNDLSSTAAPETLLSVRGDMAYSRFRILMQQVDDILGSGSSYAADSLIGFGVVPLTYEEAVQRYNAFIDSDKITGGYARLFSDYAVAMTMSVLPVFLAVLMCTKDRRSKMSELIYTRNVSALKVILSRYLAVITAVMIPIILLAYISNASVWGQYSGSEMDYLAPLKYTLGWIMPSAMISAALGMCLTELTNTPIAIAVQGFWWLFDVNAGIRSVASSYALFRLAPRHNAGAMSCFRTQDYLDNFRRLVTNRLLFAVLSILFIAITVIIYEARRRGSINEKFSFKKTASN